MDKPRRRSLVPLAALLSFVAVAALPFALEGTTTPPWVAATQRTAPQGLPARALLAPVLLSSVATPADPNADPATRPVVDSIAMSTLVAAEDIRLRVLLHHIGRLTYPIVLPAPTGRPTLVLPGPAAYTIADLEAEGAVVPLRDGTGFALEDSVLVAAGASLKLGGGAFRTLLMDSSPSGFTTLVTWGGTLVLAGDSAQAPFKITGWSSVTNKPAEDGVYGRPYIRAVGGRLDLTNVNVSSLGFWSGRTGGVAWTGISSKQSTGGAVSSSFTGNTYGVFVSRADQLKFSDDLFEGNELDGLRLHRGATNATVSGSAAARNGANGFVVSRGATGNVLSGDLAIHNGGNGFLLDGQSLVTGSSPSGEGSTVSIGTIVRYSQAQNNVRTGILVEGGSGTEILGNTVCAAVTGIAVRLGATATWVVSNDLRCGSRIALEIGPAVTGTTVFQNRLSDARIGLLIRNSPGVRIIDNEFTGISLFGVSVRGTSPGVVGDRNVIAGRGFLPVDTRGGADAPTITNTDLSGWQRRSTVTFFGYLRYHPIMTTWLIILLLVALASLIVRFRRKAPHPYAYRVPWQPAGVYGQAASAVAQAAFVPAGSGVRLQPAFAIAAPVSAEALQPEPAPQRHVIERPIIAASPAETPVVAAGPAKPFVWRPTAKLASSLGKRDGAAAGNASPPVAHTDPLKEATDTPKKAAASSDREASPFWNWLASGSWTARDEMAGTASEPQNP